MTTEEVKKSILIGESMTLEPAFKWMFDSLRKYSIYDADAIEKEFWGRVKSAIDRETILDYFESGQFKRAKQ